MQDQGSSHSQESTIYDWWPDRLMANTYWLKKATLCNPKVGDNESVRERWNFESRLYYISRIEYVSRSMHMVYTLLFMTRHQRLYLSSESTLKNMGKSITWILYILITDNKIRWNRTMCLFHGMYHSSSFLPQTNCHFSPASLLPPIYITIIAMIDRQTKQTKTANLIGYNA